VNPAKRDNEIENLWFYKYVSRRRCERHFTDAFRKPFCPQGKLIKESKSVVLFANWIAV